MSRAGVGAPGEGYAVAGPLYAGSSVRHLQVGGNSPPQHLHPGNASHLEMENNPQNEDESSIVARALETCATHHRFIESQSEYLERLRSQCATSAQLTQQEIRSLEVIMTI